MQNHKKLKRLLPQRLYHSIDVMASYRMPAWEELQAQFEAQRLVGDVQLNDAKRLHAEVYLRRNFIAEQNVRDGILTMDVDPYQAQADYFGVIDRSNQSVVAIARQIQNTKTQSLPIFKHVKLNKDYTCIEPQEVVEISAFAKRHGVESRALLLLFHEMFIHSKMKQHRYWVMAVDKKIYGRMKTLFGPVMRRIGPETFYMGSAVIPAEVALDEAGRLLKRGYRYSLPPLRGIRQFLYSSFGDVEDERISRTVFWDAYAKTYDGLLTFTPYRHLIEHVCDIALDHTPRKVLDLGCGTGNVTALLVKRNPKLHVDAVDWSQTMLDMLPKKVVGRSVNISRRDALQFLETSRQRYDVIVINNVLYTIGDRQRLWRLLKGHLREKGKIVVANPDTADSRSLIKYHMAEKSFISLLRPSLAAVWIFDSLISLNSPGMRYDFTDEQALRAEIEAAGLCIDGKIGRCYGGHTRGIDLLFSVKKKPKAV